MSAAVKQEQQLGSPVEGSFAEPGNQRRTLPPSRSLVDIEVGRAAALSATPNRIKDLALTWVAGLVESELGDLSESLSDRTKLLDNLRTGVVPCKIMNKINPGTISRINELPVMSAMASLENLASFSAALITYGLVRKHIFRPLEFVQANPKGDDAFLRNLLQLALLSQEKGFKHPTGAIDVQSVQQAFDDAAAAVATANLNNTQSLSNLASQPSRSQTDQKFESGPLLARNAPIESFSHKQSQELESLQTISRISRTDHRQSKTSASQRLTDETLAPTILKTLETLDERLKGALSETASRLDQIQSDNLTLAENLLQTIDIISKRLSSIEVSQKKLHALASIPALPAQDVERKSLANSLRLRSTSELYNGRVSEVRSETEQIPQASSPINPKQSSQSSPPAGTGTPKLYPKLPAMVLNAGLPKQEMMRLSVVYELIETEADYIRDLGIMINLHKQELLLWKVIDESTAVSIFSNAEELITANQGLLNRLNAKKEEAPSTDAQGAWKYMEDISSVFLAANDDFNTYMTYCGNYPVAMKLVHKLQSEEKFKHHMQQLSSNPTSRGLSLESFLIKPVQRICKYPLLLRELIKHTSKTMPDYSGLEKASEKMESIAAKVNEATQALDKKEKVISLLSKIESSIPLPFHDKKYLMDGICQLNKTRERHLTLFKEVLIVSKIIGKGRYALENVYHMHELVMIKSNSHMNETSLLRYNSKLTVYLQYFVDKREISFTFMDEAACTRWLEAFKSSINDPEMVLKRRIDNVSHESSSASLSGGLGTPPTLGSIGRTASGVLKKAIPAAFSSGKAKSLAPSDTQTVCLSAGSSGCDADDSTDLPDLVEIEGVLWRKTLTAKNTAYYYNPQTRDTFWTLPQEYKTVPLDYVAGTSSKSHEKSGSNGPSKRASGDRWKGWTQDDPNASSPGNQDSASSLPQSLVIVADSRECTIGGESGGEDDGTESVEGFPEWRYVFPGASGADFGYYFHVDTMQTQWQHPREADGS
ncbi:cytochrome c oxidase subunit 1 [Chytriomyces hyalinus]|nr:cytochrome c oxidase subunit 1 [Chytriomyces hyalinus]